MTDLRQSLNYSKYMQSMGWVVEKIPQFVFIRPIPFLGAIIKIQRPQGPIDFKKVDELAEKYKALFVKIEPIQQLKAKGFHPDRSPLLPTKTIWIDLTKTEKQLLKEMEKDTRSSLRKAEKQDIKILGYKDIKKFYQGFKKYGRGYIAKIKEFQSLVNCFGKKTLLLVAKKKNRIFAGAVFLIANQTAYYFYAFTSPKGRKNFSQYLIVWQAIKELKKQGIKILDLEGIYDPRFKFTQRWRGFSHFKKSFGGQEITFPGSFSKYFHPILNLLSPFLW